MLSRVKKSLRITHNALDDEVNDLIKAAKIELKRIGIHPTVVESDNEMVLFAVTLFCKANFGLDNKDSEKYSNSFTSVITAMSLSSEFLNEVEVNEEPPIDDEQEGDEDVLA